MLVLLAPGQPQLLTDGPVLALMNGTIGDVTDEDVSDSRSDGNSGARIPPSDEQPIDPSVPASSIAASASPSVLTVQM